MNLKPELEIAIHVALGEASRRRHEFAGLEHLLFALCHDPETADVLRNTGADLDLLKDKLDSHLESLSDCDECPEFSPEPTVAFKRVVERAAFQGKSSGRDYVSGPMVLVAIFSEPDSYAVSCLEDMGINRLDTVKYISHGVGRIDRESAAFTGASQSGESAGADEDVREKTASGSDPLEAFCLNLNKLAEAGNFDPLIGRKPEIDRAVRILARRRKNNPLFVGDSGVGKTAIVEGLAQKINAGEVPEILADSVIFSLDLGILLAGTRYRGDFENRFKNVLKALYDFPGAILFIDEIHNVIGAGSTTGSTMDASNLLKPALADGRLRCIGSTTWQEFQSCFEKDRALSRRFQKIEVTEPSISDCMEILKGLRARYEEFHGVRYTSKALEDAVNLSDRYLQDRKLPDKAIDLIDEAGAELKIGSGKKTGRKQVGSARIESALASMTGIPPRKVARSDRDRLLSLEEEIRSRVFGQDEAISHLVAAIKLSRAGLREPEKPVGSFLFTGPTGVGKTEVARQLAGTLASGFHRFDMSEYMERHTVSRLIGAPPGYVGFDQAGLLTDAVSKTPHSVVLMDEIEKAHPDVFNILLQVMDHGTLTDHNGKKADFRHAVLIMTSNVGARDLDARKVGFGNRILTGEEDRAYRDMFSPEFRNRLDARISFKPLDPAVMRKIVDKFIGEMAGQVRDRKVLIRVSDAAGDYLAEKGYDPSMGARPLARVIQDEVKIPLGDEMLFGKLVNGGKVLIDFEDGKLKFVFE